MRPVGILLAAGQSRRFGSDKRRLAIGHGECLLVHSARRLRAVAGRVVAVLRPGDEDLAVMLAAVDCESCINDRAHRGLGSSIACGVHATADAEAWLIQPADLPLLRCATIRRVADGLAAGKAVVPLCHGRRGHPVGFPHPFRDRLLALDGPEGARSVLRYAVGAVAWINVHDPGIYLDLDDPADSDAMRRMCYALDVVDRPVVVTGADADVPPAAHPARSR